MLTTLATLSLAALASAPMQGYTPPKKTQEAQEAQPLAESEKERAAAREQRMQDMHERNLEFTIYDPKYLDAREAIQLAKDLTETKVSFFRTDPLTGDLGMGIRDRFVQVNNFVGIQDFPDGRQQALKILEGLDERLAELGGGTATTKPVKKAETISRALRLKSLSLDTAERLVASLPRSPYTTAVEEASMLVLTGSPAAVEGAEALLAQVDIPLRQFTLHVSLIEAVDGATQQVDSSGVPADVRKALSTVAPGKSFRRIGGLMLRGSAGGNSKLEMSCSLPELSSHPENTPARVTWIAIARGFDPKSKVLSLDQCTMSLDIPTFTQTASQAGSQINFSGYRSEKLKADLALRADETTIVGTLGGDPVYVSLRYTIAD